MSFSESAHPTIIREAGGRDLPIAGALWAAPGERRGRPDRGHGRSARHQLHFRIDYHHDAKLDMWIPARMEEHYKVARSEQVDCVAVYSNARRFETSGRIVR